MYDKILAFKNNASFVSCISKINNTLLIDNAEDFDIVMPIYNVIEYNNSYLKTAGSFWNYCRDEPSSSANNNINYSIKDSKSFEYKASITGKLEGNTTKKEAEIVVPLKFLSNFLRTLDMPVMDCEVNLILTWSESCLLTSKATRVAVPAQGGNPVVAGIDNPTNATFKITDTKLYVPVITLSTGNDKKLLKQLRTRFKRTIKWKKY